MLNQGWYLNALSLAMRLYNGRIDASGQPRWLHLQQAAWHLVQRWPDAPREQVEATVLHDVLEAGTKLHTLREFHIPARTVELIQACTPAPDVPYGEWLQRAAEMSEDVRRVLYAAWTDRADPERGYPDQVRRCAGITLAMLDAALQGPAA